MMAVNVQLVEEQIRSLPAEERARLAEVLLSSLREPEIAEVEAAWAHEIDERADAYRRGASPTVPAEDVFDEVRRLTE
jgi:putative addiction module component (TIGR02574 family)